MDAMYAPDDAPYNHKALALSELARRTESCTACGLRSGCRGVVFGEGMPTASIVMIGEGPGADEDLLGRPFVGKAGQLLDRILAAAGFDRFRNAYIASVVKCRPPQNRTPEPDECNSCLPHLRDQFRIIKPRIVVLLGATALKAVIDPKGAITASRGNWVERGGVHFMATYHPAALLRNPSLKRETWSDFLQVVERYRQLVDPQHQLPSVTEPSHTGVVSAID